MSRGKIVAIVLTFLLIVVAAYQVLSAPEVVQETTGYQLIVDDQEWFALEDKEVIEEILRDYKNTYMPELPEDIKINDISFLQRVEIEEVVIHPEDLASIDEATDMLYALKEEATYIEIQPGNTLSAIASKNGISIGEIERLNPDVNIHRIFPGDKIVISPYKPKLDISVEYEETKIEAIPFQTTQQNDNTLLRSQRQVVRKGVEGERKVTYNIQVINGLIEDKTVLNQEILKEPVNQVVRVGTRQTVARGGSVNFGVVSGSRITSSFGWRTHPVSGQRSHHSGVDIGAPHGNTVYAYSQGTVSFAGWNGGYGNVIYINHGNGMETRYAHLSRMDVRVGQRVQAGQAIGRVGSTGTATGPHLHFEVRINGEPRNPLNYL